MRKGKQLVFITSPGAKGHDQGIVMPDNKLLTYVAKNVEKRCGTEIEEVKVKYDANTLNSVRGPAYIWVNNK